MLKRVQQKKTDLQAMGESMVRILNQSPPDLYEGAAAGGKA
jgi:hypothetical protein